MTNGDILEQVREASANNYLGSADEELNKYLDSIEGRVAQFQNRLQELISTTIDSSWIKGIVDFGTKDIEVITLLTDAFGGLNTILGTVAGAFAQFKGFGIASFDKNSRTWSSGLEKIGTILGGKFGQKFSNEARSQITNWFDGFDSHKNLMEAIADSQVAVPDAIYDYAEALGDVAQKEVTVGDAAMAMSQSFSKAEGLAGKLKNGLIGIFSGIGTSLLFSLGLSLATSLFSAIWKAFDENILRADEIAIERGDKLRDELGESRTSYQNSDKSARSMVDRYMELRKGV